MARSTPLGRLPVAALLAISLGCGGTTTTMTAASSGAASEPGSTEDPLPRWDGRDVSSVRLDAAAPVSSLHGALEELGAQAGTGDDDDCSMVFGDLGSVPDDARRARLSWGARDEDALVGLWLCGAALEARMRDPRMRQVAILTWRDGRVLASHPSDTSVQEPLDLDDETLRREMAVQPTMALFVTPTEGPDAAATLGALLIALRKLPRLFLFVVLS